MGRKSAVSNYMMCMTEKKYVTVDISKIQTSELDEEESQRYNIPMLENKMFSDLKE